MLIVSKAKNWSLSKDALFWNMIAAMKIFGNNNNNLLAPINNYLSHILQLSPLWNQEKFANNENNLSYSSSDAMSASTETVIEGGSLVPLPSFDSNGRSKVTKTQALGKQICNFVIWKIRKSTSKEVNLIRLYWIFEVQYGKCNNFRGGR